MSATPTASNAPLPAIRFDLFGGNALGYKSRDEEVLLSGPAGTGKSLAHLFKLYCVCEKYPGARCLIVRKTRESLTETVLVTWERDILGPTHPVLTHRPILRRVRQSYAFPNGSTVVLGGMDKPDKVLSSEWDCVIGATLVDSPCSIQHAYSRPYSGELVTIETAAGNKLAGTPNHPILAADGWIGLGSLRQGDYVVSRRFVQDKPPRAHPHIAHQPSPIADVSRSLMLSNPGCTQRHVTAPMDFHGDATDSYVDVVTTDGLFHDRFQAAIPEPLIKPHGTRRHLQKTALVRNGSTAQCLSRSRASNISSFSVRSEFLHSQSIGFGVDPRLSRFLAGLFELRLPFGVDVADMPKGLRLGLASPRDAASGHFSLESWCPHADALGNGHDSSFPTEIALDRIINVSRSDAGRGRHVYNLQTDSNWYYANNIISHNCIYVPEAIELEITDWETLGGRLRSGKVPYQQMIADCNPTTPTHWLKKRCDAGLCRLIPTVHQDNPRYFDRDKGEWTEEGKRYLARLNRMTGPRRKRFLDGVWAAAEGLVYDGYDPAVHLLDAAWMPPKSWRRAWSIDWGYVNPTVLGMWAIDGDGRAYLYREFYRTHVRAEELAKWAKRELEMGESIPEVVLCDHDPECKATFEVHSGLSLSMADKTDKTAGIEAMQARFDIQDDGRPRIYFHPHARAHDPDDALLTAGKPTSGIEELLSYVWDTRNPDRIKDEPLDKDNHSMDQARYLCRWLEANTGGERYSTGTPRPTQAEQWRARSLGHSGYYSHG